MIKKDLTIQWKENSNSLSNEDIIEITDDSFRHLDEVLLFFVQNVRQSFISRKSSYGA